MLRKRLFGISASALLGALTLAGAALTTASPAAAQGFSVTFGSGYPFYGPGFYGPRPYYGYRPAYFGGYGPAPYCWTRPTRYWDGWGWVYGRQRICR